MRGFDKEVDALASQTKGALPQLLRLTFFWVKSHVVGRTGGLRVQFDVAVKLESKGGCIVAGMGLLTVEPHSEADTLRHIERTEWLTRL